MTRSPKRPTTRRPRTNDERKVKKTNDEKAKKTNDETKAKKTNKEIALYNSGSDSDSLFTKFYNKESVSKAVSIRT